MRKHSPSVLAAAGLAVVGIIGGCTSSGLSPREVRGQDYATYVYSMYDPLATGTTPAAAHQPVATPAKVAVAQLGEVAPPSLMMDALRKEHAAFASVQPIPGVIDVGYVPGQRGTPTEYSARQVAAEQGQRMRRYASDVGADYLFLFGGTVDEATTNTPLTLANATIIGAFIVPSEKLQAQVRASGSLIDVKSGQVVLAVSADANKSRVSPTVGKETDRLELLKSCRDDVVKQLAEQLTARVKEQSSGARLSAG
jgi:hypothetical protein